MQKPASVVICGVVGSVWRNCRFLGKLKRMLSGADSRVLPKTGGKLADSLTSQQPKLNLPSIFFKGRSTDRPFLFKKNSRSNVAPCSACFKTKEAGCKPTSAKFYDAFFQSSAFSFVEQSSPNSSKPSFLYYFLKTQNL
jgi:hypothetical protein